ncbi:amino acid adenylation domain-containing protein [Brevibacillus sp. SYSU BS000544]|uniref:amino acid adenylation domain-containing protein n=1 Tax=Brevibacillus sp. SYSU BS000544 TaxID=3416443 RepID=UPI003CE47C14
MLVKKFEEQVCKSPHHHAIETDQKIYTYDRLNREVNKIARTLLKNHRNTDLSREKAALLFEHGAEMIVGMLAALKADLIYVPIDPGYPEKRAEFIIDHAEAKTIITNNLNMDLALRLRGSVDSAIQIINIDDMDEHVDESNVSIPARKEEIAYILYTSGSTGQPKGVMQNHNNILHFINCYGKELSITENDRLTLFSSYCHDAAVMDIYSALLSGATLLPKDIRKQDSLESLVEWIKEKDISIWHSVPTLYRHFMNSLKSAIESRKLRLVVLGGEAVLSYDVEGFQNKFPHAVMYNLYGQTESSYNSGLFITHETVVDKITLGGVVDHTELLVVDEQGKMVEVMGEGEIVVVGKGVSLGYWKDEERTKAVFLQHADNRRMYRTGDLGRLLPDGKIEFMGRKDFQVKISGFRVELEEIESTLFHHESVKEAVVLAFMDNKAETCLRAYFVSDREVSDREWRSCLSKSLPHYMIPASFSRIDSIPKTSTGKTDRKALMELVQQTDSREEYIAPQNETEEKLARIWSRVFGIERIGIRDNFFHLGGNSLAGLRIAAEIYITFLRKIAVSEIFNRPCIEELAAWLNESSFERTSDMPFTEIECMEAQEYYPTSYVQKRLYAIQQGDRENTSYNELKICSIKGELDKERLEKAFGQLQERHEALRTSFHVVADEIVQKIHEQGNAAFSYHKCDESFNDRMEELDELIKDTIRPFDLSEAGLLRAHLMEWNDASLLILEIHHIIADGFSTSILLKELFDLYEGKQLPDVKVQYKDFANWQNRLFNKGVLKEQEAYWLDQMKDEVPVLNLQTDHPRPSTQHVAGKTVFFELNERLAEKINHLLKSTGTTSYMLLSAALNILLAKYSGQEDIIIGTPVLGRTHPDLEQTVGMFVNTLAIRNTLGAGKTCREFLLEVKKQSLRAFENQDYDFGRLIEKLGAYASPNRNPLFDVMFSVQRFDIGLIDNNSKLEVTEYPVQRNTAKFDLALIMSDENERLQGFIEYKTGLFEKQTIERLIEHFELILEAVTKDMDVFLQDIEIVTEAEKEQIIHHFNDTKQDYPAHRTMKEIFEEEAAFAQENIAVVSNGVELGYRELNERANQLARVLRAKGITRDSIVAILCDKSIETIIAMVAVIKAGGAYLPIDEEYPEARIRYLLEDSGSRILIGKENQAKRLNLEETGVMFIDVAGREASQESKKNLSEINQPTDLAYVIYTSGTTGNPKGVCVEQKSLIKIVKNAGYIDIKEGDKLLQSGSLSFDASVQQIWLALLNGIPLHMENKELMLDLERIEEYIHKHQITHIIFPTTLFNQICQERIETFQNIRYVIAGGDIISSKQVSRLVKKYKDITVVNGYGPTENTVISTAYMIAGEWDEDKSVPIGKPVSNSTAYIMDKHHKLLPVGVPGELCVGGDGVARGYLNRPELAEEKFVLNPYVPGERIYKTGDLARWLPDGNLEFLGRMDQQVKIRGYRIELGEIEKQLTKHSQVKEAVVIDRKDESGASYLCGYLVGDGELSVAEVKEHLHRELPDYMVPAYLVTLEKLPLTPNGKIDKRALPEPDKSQTEREIVAPRNNVERAIASVWCEVLGLKQVGIEQSFFDIGGDSIKSIQIVSRLRRHSVKLEVKDIMQYKTIAEIARHIKQTETVASQDVVEGPVVLTPIIRQFAEAVDKQVFSHFNQSMMLYAKEGFEEQHVRAVLEKLVIHHDALRMRLSYDGGVSGFNKGINTKLFECKVVSLSCEQEIEQEANVLQSSMDVEAGPLVKAGLFKTNEGDHLLLIIHHLVVDGVSWRILLEDFMYGYQAAREGKPIQLPEKTTSFQEWAKKQYEYANSSKMEKEKAYWRKLAEEPLDQIPRDGETSKAVWKDMVKRTITLDRETTAKLLKETNRAYNTEINDILLSALGLAAREWCGAEKIAIALEGHGREEIVDGVDTTRTVGWFTSCYPVILEMKDQEIGMVIKRTKEYLRKVPNKGIGYGMLTQLTDRNSADLKIKADISFNYLGQFDQDVNSEWITYSELARGSEIHPAFSFDESIQMNSLVDRGEFKAKIDFNRNEFSSERIEAFAQLFKDKLMEVIACCTWKEKTEYTPTDYGINDYSLEDVQEIQKYVSENIDEKAVIQKINRLTPMQEGILFTYLNNRQTTAYVIQIPFVVEGTIDLDILERSYDVLLNRYDVLRTIIFDHWRHPAQIVLNQKKASIVYEDYSSLPFKEEAYANYKTQQISSGFDLEKDILFKINVVKMGSNDFRLLITVHHIILDGWSIAIVINELLFIYRALDQGNAVHLNEVFEYDTYIRWLSEQDQDEGMNYWREYLADYQQTITLPQKKSESEDYKDGIQSVKLDRIATEKLLEVAKRNQVTLNTICQVAWGLLLQKYSNSNDVVFGTVVSGRPAEMHGIERIVGIFINTVPVRIQNTENLTVKELIQKVQNQSNTGKKYEYLPLAEIQKLSTLKQDLVQILTVFENYPVDTANPEQADGSRFRMKKESSREQTNYDLNIAFTLENELMLDLMYNENVHEATFIEKIANQLILIFENILANEDEKVTNIEMIRDEDKERMKSEINKKKQHLEKCNDLEFSF